MNGRSVGTKGREESWISKPAIRNDCLYNTDRQREGREQRRDAELRQRGPWSFSVPRIAENRTMKEITHNKARQAVPDALPLR